MQFDLEMFQKELNICKNLTIAHFVMSFVGLFGYIIRKVAVVIIVNVMSVVLSIVGYTAMESINKTRIGMYAVLTSSLFGMIIVYEIIADLFEDQYQTEAPTQQTVMFLLTIPYIIDLGSGLMAMKLTYKMSQWEHLEFKKKYDKILVIKQDQQFDIKDIQIPDDNICVLCLQNQRNIVFYKCGHKVSCEICIGKLKQNQCPICREPILDYMKQYDP